jgi:hypothetical protein
MRFLVPQGLEGEGLCGREVVVGGVGERGGGCELRGSVRECALCLRGKEKQLGRDQHMV